MGFLCSSLLQVNNLRDIENDRRHGKWTMAALIGRSAAMVELIACDVLAYAIVFACIILNFLPWPSLLVLLTLPRSIDQVRLVSGEADAEAHNRAMARSGQLQFEFGLALVAGLILSRFFGW